MVGWLVGWMAGWLSGIRELQAIISVNFLSFLNEGDTEESNTNQQHITIYMKQSNSTYMIKALNKYKIHFNTP